MLSERFAQTFVNRVHRKLNVDINIMNEKAIIISSTMAERIGDFHIIAYELLKNNLEILSVESSDVELIGVRRPGVNLPINYGGAAIGVIGISGPPSQVLDIAKTMKFALESLLEYENKRYKIMPEQSKINSLAYAILFENPPNPTRISNAAQVLGYRDRIQRIPVLIRIKEPAWQESSIQEMKDLFASIRFWNNQDLLFRLDNQHFFFAKTFSGAEGPNYRNYLSEGISEVHKLLEERHGIPGQLQMQFFCGVPVTQFLNMQVAYNNLCWLESQQSEGDREQYFFVDHLLAYIMHNSEEDVTRHIFESYAAAIKGHVGIQVFLSTMRALLNNDMKIHLAAEELYMHKNSVQNRINKIKSVLGIKSMQNGNDCFLAAALYHYLTLHQ